MSYNVIFRSELVTVSEHSGCTCRAGRHEGGEARRVFLVRRGIFTVDGGGAQVAIDSLSAGIYDGFSPYEICYPLGFGCDTTSIEVAQELMQELFPPARFQVPFSPWTSLKHLRLYARIRNAAAPAEDIEEAAFELLADIAQAAGTSQQSWSIGPAVRRRLDDVRALMISEPDVNHSLACLAKVAGCSPFHFARLFRQETGFSVRAYRIRLRLAAASLGLIEGGEDLAGLALDSGFSHHSHMTSAFRSVLGVAPRDLRAELHSRRFLKAPQQRAA